ncbi:hypothetical protein Ddye_013787 [Dipteronia dyeriana]|uniref:Uncharacterized protein n=1 Tax=Dipteronia dyeriana TaxID=168575 RepID=A0AAD9X750_9ROSI|nr:hypothetical protein Ddye_013787 [Dipteronia dyeriana]
MRMRSALIMAIYRKQLKLQSCTNKAFDRGDCKLYCSRCLSNGRGIVLVSSGMESCSPTFSCYWCSFQGGRSRCIPCSSFCSNHRVSQRSPYKDLQQMSDSLQDVWSAPLNAATIFIVLATLRCMSEPMRVIPEALSVLIEMKISLDHLNAFLLADELSDEKSNKSTKSLEYGSDTHVEIRRNFSWE